jgi:hypothetical protein
MNNDIKEYVSHQSLEQDVALELSDLKDKQKKPI